MQQEQVFISQAKRCHDSIKTGSFFKLGMRGTFWKSYSQTDSEHSESAKILDDTGTTNWLSSTEGNGPRTALGNILLEPEDATTELNCVE